MQKTSKDEKTASSGKRTPIESSTKKTILKLKHKLMQKTQSSDGSQSLESSDEIRHLDDNLPLQLPTCDTDAPKFVGRVKRMLNSNAPKSLLVCPEGMFDE